MTRYDEAFDAMTSVDHGYRFTFRWRRPKLVTYRAADPRRVALTLNRYSRVTVIGVEVQFGQRVFGLVWGRPGPLTPDSCADCAKGVRHIERRPPATGTKGQPDA